MSTLFLEKQILATIVYYDILDYPLTAFEVFLYLVNENKIEMGHCLISMAEITGLLNSSEYLKKHIDQKHGFYFLKKIPPAPFVKGGIQLPLCKRGLGGFQKREVNIVQQRLNRKKLADRKWKKTKKIFWI